MTTPVTTQPWNGEQPPLFLVKDDVSPAEVAALVAVLRAVAADGDAGPARPHSEWSAHHRKVRGTQASGPGGWRASSMPR